MDTTSRYFYPFSNNTLTSNNNSSNNQPRPILQPLNFRTSNIHNNTTSPAAISISSTSSVGTTSTSPLFPQSFTFRNSSSNNNNSNTRNTTTNTQTSRFWSNNDNNNSSNSSNSNNNNNTRKRSYNSTHSQQQQQQLQTDDEIIPLTPQRNHQNKKRIQIYDHDHQAACIICLASTITTKGILNQCLHSCFCFDCIVQWSKCSSTCPFCRMDFSIITNSQTGEPEFVHSKQYENHLLQQNDDDDDYADDDDDESMMLINTHNNNNDYHYDDFVVPDDEEIEYMSSVSGDAELEFFDEVELLQRPSRSPSPIVLLHNRRNRHRHRNHGGGGGDDGNNIHS
jgi:hypothetical protein